ncbi:MAG: hypothetical protein KC609_04850, partial [Myxococcales bacterium]|nr:hypothetical protein [Myxococcales bacterium]
MTDTNDTPSGNNELPAAGEHQVRDLLGWIDERPIGAFEFMEPSFGMFGTSTADEQTLPDHELSLVEDWGRLTHDLVGRHDRPLTSGAMIGDNLGGLNWLLGEKYFASSRFDTPFSDPFRLGFRPIWSADGGFSLASHRFFDFDRDALRQIDLDDDETEPTEEWDLFRTWRRPIAQRQHRATAAATATSDEWPRFGRPRQMRSPGLDAALSFVDAGQLDLQEHVADREQSRFGDDARPQRRSTYIDDVSFSAQAFPALNRAVEGANRGTSFTPHLAGLEAATKPFAASYREFEEALKVVRLGVSENDDAMRSDLVRHQMIARDEPLVSTPRQREFRGPRAELSTLIDLAHTIDAAQATSASEQAPTSRTTATGLAASAPRSFGHTTTSAELFSHRQLLSTQRDRPAPLATRPMPTAAIEPIGRGLDIQRAVSGYQDPTAAYFNEDKLQIDETLFEEEELANIPAAFLDPHALAHLFAAEDGNSLGHVYVSSLQPDVVVQPAQQELKQPPLIGFSRPLARSLAKSLTQQSLSLTSAVNLQENATRQQTAPNLVEVDGILQRAESLPRADREAASDERPRSAFASILQRLGVVPAGDDEIPGARVGAAADHVFQTIVQPTVTGFDDEQTRTSALADTLADYVQVAAVSDRDERLDAGGHLVVGRDGRSTTLPSSPISLLRQAIAATTGTALSPLALGSESFVTEPPAAHTPKQTPRWLDTTLARVAERMGLDVASLSTTPGQDAAATGAARSILGAGPFEPLTTARAEQMTTDDAPIRRLESGPQYEIETEREMLGATDGDRDLDGDAETTPRAAARRRAVAARPDQGEVSELSGVPLSPQTTSQAVAEARLA